MKYRAIEQIQQTAIISPEAILATCSQRLARWAYLLEGHDAHLRLLQGVEFRPVNERGSLRTDKSPLTLAYADPLLRSQGLNGDTYGAALGFFQISEKRMHRIVCSCLHFRGPLAKSQEVASEVRRAEVRARFVEEAIAFFGIAFSRARIATSFFV